MRAMVDAASVELSAYRGTFFEPHSGPAMALWAASFGTGLDRRHEALRVPALHLEADARALGEAVAADPQAVGLRRTLVASRRRRGVSYGLSRGAEPGFLPVGTAGHCVGFVRKFPARSIARLCSVWSSLA